MLAAVSALVVPAYVPATGPAAPVRAVRSSRQGAVFMDETIMEKALAGELEQEGAENVFMSELGWATYLDQNAGGSYNMNQRPSMAEDGYFTADIFSNPLDVVGDFVNGLKRVASKPLAVAFPSISNDESGARSYPKGYDEIKARTIAPKVKDFNPKLRITGIPGFNAFGTPSSKQQAFLDDE